MSSQHCTTSTEFSFGMGNVHWVDVEGENGRHVFTASTCAHLFWAVPRR
jgi:hypothetical protein